MPSETFSRRDWRLSYGARAVSQLSVPACATYSAVSDRTIHRKDYLDAARDSTGGHCDFQISPVWATDRELLRARHSSRERAVRGDESRLAPAHGGRRPILSRNNRQSGRWASATEVHEAKFNYTEFGGVPVLQIFEGAGAPSRKCGFDLAAHEIRPAGNQRRLAVRTDLTRQPSAGTASGSCHARSDRRDSVSWTSPRQRARSLADARHRAGNYSSQFVTVSNGRLEGVWSKDSAMVRAE